ncbi:MAG: AMP-binding protein [Opitutales bacterium]|nr:AMP-binding protein [Opitutales bacterium]
MNLVEALRTVAQKQPNTIGLRIPQRDAKGCRSYREKTFREMDQEADEWATYFFAKGFSRGQKVLLLVPPGEDLLLSVFALLRLGAVPIVIDPGMGFKNFFRCVRKTQPELFLSISRARGLYLFLKGWVPFRGALFISKRWKRKLAQRHLACRLQPEDRSHEMAAILFTSGSTGHPKGAVYTYAELNAQMEALLRIFHIQPGEVDLPLLPVFSLYNPAMGLTTVLPEMDPAHPSTLDPHKILSAILENHVTHSFGSPCLWSKLVEYCEQQHRSLPSVKRLFLAGAPVSPFLLKRVQALLPNGQAFTPYGATEALPVAYISAKEVMDETYAKTLQGCGTCVGHPVVGVQVRILPICDGEMDQLPPALPTGTIGEIAVSAPYMSKCYFRDERATRNAKVKDANGVLWHRMGDVGYFDEKGRLWFCGRKVERVVTPQQTFYTDCCEAIFNHHPQVFRSALIAFAKNGSVVPAIVIEPKRRLSSLEVNDLLRALRMLAKSVVSTQPICHFCTYASFPVDIRHNAKIHRGTLSRYFQKHPNRVKVFEV